MSAILSTINQLVTFQLESDILGVDIMHTQEILSLGNLRKVPNSPFYFDGMLDLRGTVLPVINFKKLFNFGTFDLSRDKGIVIIKDDNKKCFGVIIDEILRVVNIEKAKVKKIPESFSKSLKQYISGVVEVENELISILDIKAIFQTVVKDLGKNAEDDQVFLDFRRDKFKLLDTEEEKQIYHFLDSFGVKQNMVTSIGAKNYFSRMRINTNLPIDVVLNDFKTSLAEKAYNVLAFKKSIEFFDYYNDYFNFLAILESVILPIKKKQGLLNIKIVNLQCGKGFECYSILFILKAFIPNFSKWNIEIIAFNDDYNELSFASEGLYQEEYLLKVSNCDYDNFFYKEKEGYKVKDELRKMIKFRFGTVKNFEPVKNVDLFFCRGVFAKLGDNVIRRVVLSIKESLGINGILLLGELEDLLYINQPLVSREINGRKFYLNV